MGESNRRINSHSFEDKLEVADEAALKVEEYFVNKGINVRNVEGVKYYQSQDVDFIMDLGGKKKKKFELKADTYYMKNFYIEVISNKDKNTTGCFLYTKSDYILYYYVNHGKCFIIPTKEFQEWFNKNIDRFEEPRSKVFTPVGNDGEGYFSEGRLVPVNVMVEELKLKSITI